MKKTLFFIVIFFMLAVNTSYSQQNTFEFLVIRTGSNEEGKLTFNENDIGKWHIGKSSDGSRLFFYSYDLQNTVMQLKNNGYVGIGTTAPKSDLQIGTGSHFENVSGWSDISNNIYWNGTSWIYSQSEEGSIIAQDNGGNFRFYTAPLGIAGNAASITERMQITNAGNVGIGTADPSAKLDVAGDMLLDSRLRFDVANGWDGTSAVFGLDAEVTGKKFLFWDYPGNKALMVIKDDGNVGIGTTQPVFKLDVVGGGLRLQEDNGKDVYMDIYQKGVMQWGIKNPGGKTSLSIVEGGSTERLTIAKGGNVGIGTTNPGTKLHVKDGAVHIDNAGGYLMLHTEAGGAYIREYNQDIPIYFMTNDGGTHGFRMTIAAAGNVGIGTRNPSDKLEVSGGNIRVTGGDFIDDNVAVKDYVFEKDYSLMSMHELRAFVSREKHLPNVPNADDIEKDGLNVSEFQMTLLEKIEELTLYTLQQQKQIESLRKQVNELGAQLK
jgi:hypothetical protein